MPGHAEDAPIRQHESCRDEDAGENSMSGTAPSYRIAELLRKMGHKNVRVLEDGWRGYRRTGLPVELGPGNR